MKNVRRSVLSLMLGLFAFLLTGVNAVNLHASGGTSYDQRITRLEQLAENQQAAASGINSGDNAWLLVSSALVLMMTAPGLILFYGGLVRGKNVLATMMHGFALMGVVTILWANIQNTPHVFS